MNGAVFLLWAQGDLDHGPALQTGEFSQEFIEACEAKGRHRHLMNRVATVLKWASRQRGLPEPVAA